MPDQAAIAKSGPPWFRVFKYAIYALLSLNIYLFFREDFAASSQTFASGVGWYNAVEAFSATVDTLAWVILLLLFELETAVIPDERLRGRLKWVLSGVRAVCYTFIVYSFYGYLVKYGVVTHLLPLGPIDACSLLGQGYFIIDSLDKYEPLTAQTCAVVQGQPLFQIADTQIVGNAEQAALVSRLATTDVVNAADWLIVVVLLEVEVTMQIKGLLTRPLLVASKYCKAVLYSILLACAIYWGIDGDFLDFWDAFLWLVAFAFIEMNIFEWNAETQENHRPLPVAAQL